MSLKEEINYKTILKRDQTKLECHIFILTSYFFVTIAYLRKILIVVLENKKIINNNILDFYYFIYLNLFLKNKFDNIFNIFDIDCNFNKKKAKNLRKRIE